MADLLELGVSNCGALKQQLDAGGLTWNAHVAEHPPSSPKADSFAARLDQFLYLLFYEVDARTAAAKSKAPAAGAPAAGAKPGTAAAGSNKT